MGYRVVAYAAAGTHFAFLAFGVLGGFLAWRWPRLIWLQAAGAAWLVLVVAADVLCPLTWIEDRARERAGMAAQSRAGSCTNYIEGVFFPAGQQTAAMIAAGAVVADLVGGLRGHSASSLGKGPICDGAPPRNMSAPPLRW